MSSDGLTSVNLYVSDLQPFAKRGITRWVGPGTHFSPDDLLSVCYFLHWTLEINDKCYEITSTNYDDIFGSETRPVFRSPSLRQWKNARQNLDLKYVCFKVGMTAKNDSQIWYCADRLWTYYMRRDYSVLKNCQDFVHMLYDQIHVDPATLSLPQLLSCSRMPNPANHVRDVAVEMSLVAGIVVPPALSVAYAFTHGQTPGEFIKTHKKTAIAGTAISAASLLALTAYERQPEKYLRKQKAADKWANQLPQHYGYMSTDFLDGTADLRDTPQAYSGYNIDNINIFAQLGYSVPQVVKSFTYLGIPANGGQPYDFSVEQNEEILATIQGSPSQLQICD